MTLRHDGVSRPKPKTPEMLFRTLRQRPEPLESLGGQCSGSSRPNCSASELYYPDNSMKQMGAALVSITAQFTKDYRTLVSDMQAVIQAR